MSDRDTDLSAVLDRATDRIGPADSAQHDALAALARARVLRNRRRAGVVGAVAAVTVLAVVLAVTGRGLHRADAPVAPSTTVPQVRGDVVQGVWDPRTAPDLPPGSTGLPADLTPPAHPAALPLPGPARAVLDHGDRPVLDLLGTDGTWAQAQLPSGTVNGAALSRDGTMLAVLGGGAVWVTDVREGTWHRLALPSDGQSAMWTSIAVRPSWIGDTQVVLDGGGGGVAVLSADGSAEPTSGYFGVAMVSGLAVTPDRTSLLFGVGRHSKVIREIRDGRPVRTYDASALERFSLPVASRDRVVGTVSGIPGEDRPTDHAGVQVLDRTATYATTAYLPIARTHYQPGLGIAALGVDGVRPLAWVDGHTVLVQTGSSSYGPAWQLVTWDVDSGDLALAAEGGPRTHLAAVAADLVAPGS